MKKLFFLLFLLAGCDQSSDRSFEEPKINKIFADSDANGLFAGSPVKLWVELEGLPDSDGWMYDFVVDGDILESIPVKSSNGFINTFHSFTPDVAGDYIYEGVLRNGSVTYSEEIVFEVMEP